MAYPKQSDRFVTFFGENASVNVSIRLSDLDRDQRQRLREMFDDGVIDDDEMYEVMRMKRPDWFPGPVPEEVVVSARGLSPARRQKIVWLSIVGPSAAASLVLLLAQLL